MRQPNDANKTKYNKIYWLIVKRVIQYVVSSAHNITLSLFRAEKFKERDKHFNDEIPN